MKKSLAIIPAAVAIALALAACSGGSGEAAQSSSSGPAGSAPSSSASQSSSAADETLDGTWVQDDPSADGAHEAAIKNGVITINISGDGSKSLYWKGTAPKGASTGWTSKADTDALAASITGSQDTSKAFKVDGDTLSYKFSALGSETTIELHKK